MDSTNEKAQSVTWNKQPTGLDEERTSFKKKKKYVYLEKYENTIQNMNKDIVSLKNGQMRLWIVIIGLVACIILTNI